MKSIQDFAIELVIRFLSDTPWFFKVISWIAFILASVTTIPVAAAQYGIDLPEWVDPMNNNLIMAASWVALIIARLPVTTSIKEAEALRD